MTKETFPDIEVQTLATNDKTVAEQFNPLLPSPGYAINPEAEKFTINLTEGIDGSGIGNSAESANKDIDVIGGLHSSSNPSPVSASREYRLTLPASLSEQSIPRSAKSESGIRKSSIPLTLEPEAVREVARNPKCQEELNWCSYEDLENNYDLLSEGTLGLLYLLNQKRDYMETKYPGYEKATTNLYLQNMPPLVMSGFSRASSIAYCCRNKKPCRSWMFCSICSKHRANDGKKRFSRAFHKDTFLSLTCSFDGDIPLSATDNPIREYWLSVNECLRSMIKDGYINGAYIGHEIAVRSFMPARVLPHSHALITSSEEDLEKLRALIHERLAADETIALVPSIKIDTIDFEDFDNRIAYVTKSLDLKKPYGSAWELHVTQNPKKAIELNIEMKNTVDVLGAAALNFDRIVLMGNLRTQNSRTYIGEKVGRTRNRKKPRKRRQEAKKKANARKKRLDQR